MAYLGPITARRVAWTACDDTALAGTISKTGGALGGAALQPQAVFMTYFRLLAAVHRQRRNHGGWKLRDAAPGSCQLACRLGSLWVRSCTADAACCIYHCRDVDMLEAAMDSHDEQQLISAVAQLQAAEASSKAAFANQTAAHRSGLRGLKARNAAIAADKAAAETVAVGQQMSHEAAAAAAQELITDLYQKLAELDVDAAEGRARQILTGLGFSKERMDSLTGTLSGGWRMRVALACALFGAPDILCLDEPTNHLDLEAILWLQVRAQKPQRLGEQWTPACRAAGIPQQYLFLHRPSVHSMMCWLHG